ncbi:MAG: hypothetical protein Q8L61_05270 [Hyphomicrobium sp.]|nr:hypothetical protein [Hyphomicrobium sp.]
MLAQNTNDLLFGETASPHRSSPSDKLTYQWHEFRGAGQLQKKSCAPLNKTGRTWHEKRERGNRHQHRHERTIHDTWQRISDLLDRFSPAECANYLRHAGYACD